MKTTVLKIVCILFLTSLVGCNSRDGECSCELDAYVIDTDKGGTNVRDKPNGKIIDNLKESDLCRYAVPIKIHRSEANWCYITSYPDCGKQVKGWVSSTLIFTSLTFHTDYNEKTDEYNTPPLKLFLKPQANKEEIVGYFHERQDVNVLKCCKGWAYVKGKNKKNKIISGWIQPEDLCSNPNTTCN